MPGPHRAAAEAAERFAACVLTEAEFQQALLPVVEVWAVIPPATRVEWDPEHYMTGATRHLGSAAGARYAASYAARGLARTAGPRDSPGWDAARDAEQVAQGELLQDILGPASRPAIDPRWLTSTVVTLARTIYDDRAFDRLPVLADALEEAGCDDPDILSHCRGGGHHVRGCWVVDLVLGKS
jgi:hypothetical protein